ncbi:response regulator [Chryseobacterium sp. MYb264]|uniref:LytR/AlgR family response regulator transcription factor n=1 Tax=Chryseobacterium sp. MYb264 TaxID=2745153 RepID=UPI002E142B74|nr:response regulator [Chryseobacterium sp. MYb264]
MTEAHTYKCLIVDDEPAAHYVLMNYIEKHPDLLLSGQCYHAIEALSFLRDQEIDLLFLDINMPELSGLEFLKLLPNPPKTILTTAYSEYALESYEFGVIDYLLKPISSLRFIKSVERFLSYQNPSFKQNPLTEPTHLKIKVNGKDEDIRLDEISYIQSYGNFIKIFMGRKFHLVSMTTQEVLKNLPSSQFLRIHKSYIVSLQKIERFENNEISMDDIKLPVGITFKQKLQDFINTAM